ncbi:MAG: lectin-like protein [Myxococcota bacterium]
MRGWVAATLLCGACTFGGGVATSGIGAGSGSTSDDVGETERAAAETNDTIEGDGEGDGGGSAGGGPMSTGENDGGSAEVTDGGASAIEVCNGMDDDGDGFVDEFSSANAECGPCRYAVGPHTQFVYSFCSEEVTAILADLDCGVLGARLATIPDAETDAFVFAQAGGVRSFIGYSDESQEGTWVWVDGTPRGYENWDFGEPNNAAGDQDCAVVRSEAADWDDVRCNLPHAYICRAPL